MNNTALDRLLQRRAQGGTAVSASTLRARLEEQAARDASPPAREPDAGREVSGEEDRPADDTRAESDLHEPFSDPVRADDTIARRLTQAESYVDSLRMADSTHHQNLGKLQRDQAHMKEQLDKLERSRGTQTSQLTDIQADLKKLMEKVDGIEAKAVSAQADADQAHALARQSLTACDGVAAEWEDMRGDSIDNDGFSFPGKRGRGAGGGTGGGGGGGGPAKKLDAGGSSIAKGLDDKRRAELLELDNAELAKALGRCANCGYAVPKGEDPAAHKSRKIVEQGKVTDKPVCDPGRFPVRLSAARNSLRNKGDGNDNATRGGTPEPRARSQPPHTRKRGNNN